MNHAYQNKLKRVIEKGGERSLLSFEYIHDFWTNDYLGLGKEQKNILLSGSGGSRLIAGNTSRVEEIEHDLALFFNSEAALFYNSGYDANVGFFSSVPQRGDTILYDEFIHASARDGIRLGFANHFSFKHNDLEDLERQISTAEGTCFVAVESLYSMDGDLALLKEISLLCTKQNALLIVDEAHAGAVFGALGQGFCNELGIENACFARLITFGKGFGAHGALWLCDQELRKFLINFSRSLIYTTALPLSIFEHVLEQVHKNKTAQILRKKLQENIAYFRSKGDYLDADTRSPIQVVRFESKEKCTHIALKLQQNKIGAKAIMSPTVPEGKERIRICLHAFNTFEEINELLTILTF